MEHVKSNTLFADMNAEGIYDIIPKPIVIADNIATPDNMGSLIRLSDNIGASEVIFLGDDAHTDMKKVRRAAASSRDNIKWSFTTETDLRKTVGPTKTLVAIETADAATCIFDTALPDDAAFVVGNESKGMRNDILSQCDMAVYIPVPGPTRSLNVSHAASVALFEWLRQMRAKHGTNAKKEYRHVFFDFDRTLWDFDAAAEAAFEQLMTIHGLKDKGIPSAKEFYAVYHPMNEELWTLYRADKISKQELSLARFVKPLLHYGIDDTNLAQRLSDDYVSISPRMVRLVDGTKELLDYLKPKYHLHIITNGFSETQMTKLKGAGLADYFDTITVSEEAGVKKPNPDFFRFALKKADATPRESIVVGDEMAVDIDGARAAGIDQIFFNPSKQAPEGKTTYEVASLHDIKSIL